jgi:hypothetical protein
MLPKKLEKIFTFQEKNFFTVTFNLLQYNFPPSRYCYRTIKENFSKVTPLVFDSKDKFGTNT